MLREIMSRRVGMLLIVIASVQVTSLVQVFLPTDVYAAPVQLVLTGGTSWTVPPAWNNANNTIEAIGAGGNGGNAVGGTLSGAGGGGGEYRRAVNVVLTPNSSIDINISTGGAGSAADGTWLKNGGGTIQIEAKNGGNASGDTAGAGGTGGVGSVSYNGGSGGSGATASNTASAGGGGGSAGPSGVGRAGGAGRADVRQGGGGGGGSNGASSTVGVTSSSGSEVGGDGGQGTSGTGGGAGGTGRNSSNASDGTDGGGGGGASTSTGASTSEGGNGGVESLWDVSVGPSGGGGGAGGANGTGRGGSATGGDGGTYGGGGGGGGMSGSNTSVGGSGGQGILIITYEPTLDPSITQADYRFFENFDEEGVKWQDCRTHSGTTSIVNGSMTSVVSLAIPISDVSQAFLMTSYSGAGSAQNAENHMISSTITNSTTLTFTRGGTNSDAEVSYSLIECYRGEFEVQRGRTAIASGSNSATDSVSSVDTDDSMVIVSNYSNDSSANQQTSLVTGELLNSTTVLFERADSPTVTSTVDWQVIEFADNANVSVQTGETVLGTGSSSATASIAAVTTSSSWLYCSYDATNNGLRQTAVGCDLPSSSIVEVNRYSSSNYTNRVRWYVVEFPDSLVSVQRGAYVDSGGSTDNTRYDIDIPLASPVVSLTKSFSYKTNTTSGTGSAFPRNSWINILTAPNTLQTSYWRGSSNGAGTHYWQVIEFFTPPADVSSPIAAENTAANLTSVGQTFRLRLLLGVDDATLGQGSQFKLQLAQLSGSCSASSYSDVTTNTYYDLVGVENGQALVTNANDPVDGTRTTKPQSLVEANDFENSESFIAPGEAGLWDFSLHDNGAPPSTTYCFRVVKADGSPLDSYAHYPTVTSVGPGLPEIAFVDEFGAASPDPSFSLSQQAVAPVCQTATGQIGSVDDVRLRITQDAYVGNGWNIAIAPTSGNVATWQSGSYSYDFNDPAGAGCGVGSDGDTVAGQLTIDGSTSVSEPKEGCDNTGINVTGSANGFESGSVDSITLVGASASASPGCYWDFYGSGLLQTIPINQQPGNYSIDLTITVTSS